MFNADTVRAIKPFALDFEVSKGELISYGLVALLFWRLPEILKYSVERFRIMKSHEIKSRKLNEKIKKTSERRKKGGKL